MILAALLALTAPLSLAPAAASGAASAKSSQQRDAARLLKPFSAICLDHIGDPEAQAGAAMAAPWNAVEGKTENGDTRYELPGAIQLTLAPAGDGVCSITGMLDPAIDRDVIADALSEILPLGEGQPGNNSMVWTMESPETHRRFGFGVLVSPRSGGNLGTVMVQNLR